MDKAEPGWIRLADAGSIYGGGTPSKSNPSFWGGDIPWITPKVMKTTVIGDSPERITNAGLEATTSRLIPPPAVVFVVRGMILAREVPIAVTIRPVVINQDMKAIVPRKGIDAYYLAAMMRGAKPTLLNMIEVAGHGTCKLTSERWSELRIPLLKPSDQRTLVRRLEKLTRHLHRAIDLHHEAEQDTARLFQAGLESAFSERHIAGWPIYEASRLFTPVNGQVDPRVHAYADMPHVGPDSIESGTCRILSETIQTPRQLGLKSGKYPFGPEHVLYSKIRPALRKVALPDFSGVCSADMYPLLPNREIITREFLALSLLSPAFSRYAVDNSDRNAMPKINRKTLFAFEMPVPDKAIQRQIAAELFGMQRESEKLAKMQRAVSDELDSFTPALLAKAFRGEL